MRHINTSGILTLKRVILTNILFQHIASESLPVTKRPKTILHPILYYIKVYIETSLDT
jgi:hypothetical protein